MRAIDADALMKDVRENSESYFADDFAEFWVNRQPTIQPEPHWISCKKELPKLDIRCVLLYSNDNISGGYYRGNRTFDVDYGDEDVNTMVIAWMPLPEPYKEVTE